MTSIVSWLRQVWASLDLSVLPSRPRLLVLHDLGASFRFPSSCLTEEVA